MRFMMRLAVSFRFSDLTFNTLYEIRRGKRVDPKAGLLLSILSMRFTFSPALSRPFELRAFQYSLWDSIQKSDWRIHTPPSTFQYSLWDSPRSWPVESFCGKKLSILSMRFSGRLSILSMRFQVLEAISKLSPKETFYSLYEIQNSWGKTEE